MHDEDKLCGPSCPKKECKNNVLLKKKKKNEKKKETLVLHVVVAEPASF